MKRWQRIYDVSDYCCVYCGDKLDLDIRIFHSATEDHLYRRGKTGGQTEGANSKENLVAACQLCNSLKGDFIPSIAKTDGVLVKTHSGKIEVASEYRNEFIKQVRDEILKRKKERLELLESERKRRANHSKS